MSSEDLHREARRKQRDAARTKAIDNKLAKDVHKDLSLWQAIKRWHRIFWFCIGLSSTIVLYGYDYVIIATVSAMPSFQEDFGEIYKGQHIIPSIWLALWTFISPVASMPGSIFGGYFQDHYGRRWSLALGTVLSAIGVAICYVSDLPETADARRGVFLAGKAFLGGAIGMIMTTCQTYMSEVLPPRLRGSLLAFFPIFTLLGQLIGSGVIFATLDSSNGYRIAFASQWAFAAIPLIMSLVIPESPTYLIRKNRLEDATKCQRRLEKDETEVLDTIAALETNIEHERELSGATYLDCFSSTHIRQTLIILWANVMPQIFGISLLASASYFAQLMGMTADMSVIILILGIIFGLLANVASMWVLMHIGRRTLIVYGFAALFVIWLGVGIAGIWNGRFTMIFCATLMILVTVIGSLTVWPASYVVGSETSALHLRGKAQGLGWMVSGGVAAIFGFCLPYMYNPDQGNLRAKVGFVYSGLCLIFSIGSYFWVPEMKGRTPAEIDRMFELKLPSKDFASWRPDNASSVSEKDGLDSYA